MSWYLILFVATFAIFIVKLLISVFAGDFDLDVDLDGDSDCDTSSAFSFKGALHFLMGFSALGILPFFFSKEGVKDVQSN